MYIHVDISYFCCIPSHNDAACSSHARKSVIGCIGPFCTSSCGLIKMLKKKRERERERERERDRERDQDTLQYLGHHFIRGVLKKAHCCSVFQVSPLLG